MSAVILSIHNLRELDEIEPGTYKRAKGWRKFLDVLIEDADRCCEYGDLRIYFDRWTSETLYEYYETCEEFVLDLASKTIPFRLVVPGGQCWLCGCYGRLNIDIELPEYIAEEKGIDKVVIPLVFDCRGLRHDWYCDVTIDFDYLEREYGDVVFSKYLVDAVKSAIRDTWWQTVKKALVREVNMEEYADVRLQTVLEWKPNVDTVYVGVSCTDNMAVFQLPLYTLYDRLKDSVPLAFH